MSNDVRLAVDGLDYYGWTSLAITAGIERQAREFRVGLSWRWPGQVNDWPIRQGARCQVFIGSDLVVTGFVDATPGRYDGQSITREVTGRSLTADLVDCAAINSPGQWRGAGLQQIVRDLAEPYGVAVVSEVGPSAKLADHTIEPGESVFKSVDRLLTIFRLFATDDAQGRAVLAKPGSGGRSVDQLRPGEGGNIVTGNATLDFSGVFSEYRCIGQRSGNDDEFGAAASEVTATAMDDRVERRRVLVIHESGQMTPELARSRVNWERGSRLGKALSATYEVRGWRQSNGELWRPNVVVRVVDPLLGFDRDMLISEVTYTLDDQGERVTLAVGPPDGFEPEPQDPLKRRKIKRGGKADNFEYLLPPDWEKDQ